MASRLGNAGGDKQVVLFNDFLAVADADYIRDTKVGARINSNAIRLAMQWGLDTQAGIFHVHMHPWKGRPLPSQTDRREIPELMPAFRGVSKQSIHGILILSPDSASAWAWPPGEETAIQVHDISIVGFPITILR